MITLETGPKIVIVGAGVAGLAFAINLKRKFGYENYTIYEQAGDVGGTWRENKYPGCSSDIGIHFYSLSTDLKPDWEYSHGYQPQIQGYWRDLSFKYQIHPHIVFRTRVVSAEWNESEQLYYITTKNLIRNEQQTIKAEILISALGILDVPNYPEIPGIDTFGGTKFHSGEWDSSCDLTGKRVGVIGNGASATQLVPVISEDPKVDVVNFCKTPNWLFPPVRTKTSKSKIWALRYIPFYARLLRFSLFLRGELAYFIMFGTRFLHPTVRKRATTYIKRTAPKEYHANLVPTYTMGCKRIIYDTDYLKALHRPNLRLNWDGIESINKDGIVTKTGQHVPLDVLVLATGYVADDYALHVRGKTQTVKEYYDAAGGPKAYLGTTIPGFPNLFVMGGPNTTTGHTSVIFFEEVQVDYALQLIKPILEGTVSSVEVTPEATEQYNERIHAKLARSVYLSCQSWYRRNRTGKVTSIFPGAASLFWWWLRRANLAHYVGVPENKWNAYRRQQRLTRIMRWLGAGLLVALTVGLSAHVKTLQSAS